MLFKLQNKFIPGFISWIGLLGEATGKQTRMRVRLMTLLIARLNEMSDLHKQLLIKYSTKDEKGEPVTKDVNGVVNYDVSNEMLAEFQKEDQELLNENFIIEITPANQEMFQVMKDFVLNTNYTFGPSETDTDEQKQLKIQQANDYDTWCNAFEDAN